MAVNTGTHDFAGTTACCRCGATIEAIADNFVSASCSNAINPKLIERIARAMCKAEGNDPDAKCLRAGVSLMHLSGVVAAATYEPHETQLRPAWALYAYAAATAIIELEAAAMENPAWWSDGEIPVERTPWFPPHLFQMNMEPTSIDASNLTAVQTEDGIKLAPKDAPLIGALRKQRERDGF